jgi:hypothetical protein
VIDFNVQLYRTDDAEFVRFDLQGDEVVTGVTGRGVIEDGQAEGEPLAQVDLDRETALGLAYAIPAKVGPSPN